MGHSMYYYILAQKITLKYISSHDLSLLFLK